MTRARIDPLTVYGIAFLVFLYGPVLLLPVFSFNDSLFAIFPLRGFTLKNYADMLGNAGMIASLQNSLVVGSIVSILSTGLGLLASLALTRTRVPFRNPVLGGIMLPLVVPSLIFGIGILVVLRQVLGLDLSLWTIGMGHILICVPYAIMVLMARLEGFDKSLEEASADLGERPWMTFWRVTFPLALPGVVSSLIMCFTVSFDEFVIAFFLSGTDTTLPVFMFSQLRFPNKLPGTMALGASILVASAILVVASELIRRRGVPAEKSTG